MLVTNTLHLLAAVAWVGGMFFAYMVLRPAAVAQLEPPERLKLWAHCFGLFFPWVWTCIIILPVTGYWAVFKVFGGFANAGLYIHIMHGLGLIMILLFLLLFFLPYQKLKRHVRESNFAIAGAHLATIRKIVGSNLLLGLVTIVIASVGRFL